MPKYAEKGRRLREFIDSQNWTKAEFARRMGIPQQNVNRYLTGELDPMNLAEELLGERCDIVWLMTGRDVGEPKEQPEEEKRMIRLLKELGIDTEEKLRGFVNPENIAQDIALVMRERLVKYQSKKTRKK
jgi:transcriptional regulator with XRE-family HTH domain